MCLISIESMWSVYWCRWTWLWASDSLSADCWVASWLQVHFSQSATERCSRAQDTRTVWLVWGSAAYGRWRVCGRCETEMFWNLLKVASLFFIIIIIIYLPRTHATHNVHEEQLACSRYDKAENSTWQHRIECWEQKAPGDAFYKKLLLRHTKVLCTMFYCSAKFMMKLADRV